MKNKRYVFAIFFLLLTFISCSTSYNTGDEFLQDKIFIYSVLKNHYGGFRDIRKRGFNRKEWFAAGSYDELSEILNKYICDGHLKIAKENQILYKIRQTFDSETYKSTDAPETFVVKETSNTLYIRCNSCDSAWKEYNTLPAYASRANDKDFIVLDFRSNNGGGKSPQFSFFNNLVKMGYNGTIFVCQDNWSYSSGEVWSITDNYRSLNFKLIGTHSGGAQGSGNCKVYEKNCVYMYVPLTKFTPDSSYLGEGIGYEPEIWAETQNMKDVLEGLGLDLSEIEIK